MLSPTDDTPWRRLSPAKRAAIIAAALIYCLSTAVAVGVAVYYEMVPQ